MIFILLAVIPFVVAFVISFIIVTRNITTRTVPTYLLPIHTAPSTGKSKRVVTKEKILVIVCPVCKKEVQRVKSFTFTDTRIAYSIDNTIAACNIDDCTITLVHTMVRVLR